MIANNIFYFESEAQTVAGDQKKKEIDADGIPNVVFNNNLFLRANNWPSDFPFKDSAPTYGNPVFKNIAGLNKVLVYPIAATNWNELINTDVEASVLKSIQIARS